MPEYLAPAVFVEETSFRSKSIEGVGTSTAAFVGLTSRGPVATVVPRVTPPLLTSFADFERIYGGFEDLIIDNKKATNYVAHAVRSFFNNGGGRIYVARILGTAAKKTDSVALKAKIGDPNPAAGDSVSIGARFEGGARIPNSDDVNLRVTLQITEQETTKLLSQKQTAGVFVKFGDKFQIIGVDKAENSDDAAFAALKPEDPVKILTLNVLIEDPAGNIHEYSSLGFHSRHPRFAGSVLGVTPPRASDALTNPIVLELGANVKAAGLYSAVNTHFNKSPENWPFVELKNGSDGTSGPIPDSYGKALKVLAAHEDVSIIAAPGSSDLGDDKFAAAVNNELIIAAEARRAYRIAVLDTRKGLEPAGAQAAKSTIDSKYAALYYPWVMAPNPMAGIDSFAPSEIALPPSGFVCGIYARSDIQRGVWKAPANETISGALRLERDVSFGEQELLNPLGVNCLRYLPNRGYRVWGARTTSSDPEWKYVNIRRYFLYLESSIDRGSQWAVFEPNGERLWANVREMISDFLYNEWVNGALLGNTPKEAFFVRCDRSTMTQNDLDNGRLVCLIGVAAIKPAEFVIFRIGQKTADAKG